MFSGDNTVYLIYALAAIAAVIVVETVFLLFSARSDKRDTIKDREGKREVERAMKTRHK